MTAEEAEQAIKDQVENYSVKIIFKDRTEEIQGKDIGYTYQSDNKAQAGSGETECFFWPKGLFKGETYTAGYKASVDEKKLTEKLLSFSSMQKKNMTPAKDAYIAFEDNQFVIKKETQGTVIDENLFMEKVKAGIEKRKKRISAAEEGVYAVPAVLQNDEKLKEAAASLERLRPGDRGLSFRR